MNRLRMKSGKQFYSQLAQKSKTPRCKLNIVEVKVLYNENYKTLKKEIKEDT
jgi:hypothetical protein